MLLGKLGNRHHFKCRACGMEFSRSKLRSSSRREPRKAAKNEYPAGYMQRRGAS